jgi:FkbM family methyltransferase
MILPNFTKIPMESFLGKTLRFPLRFIPKDIKIPILQGEIRGKKWIVGSSNHGCWLGTYEYEKRIRFEKKIYKGAIVYDIGAHAGYYTLLASVLVGEKGLVFAFEPLPANLVYLRKHIEINHCTNVIIKPVAVFDKPGVMSFRQKGNFNSESCLSYSGDIQVKVVNLDSLISADEIPPADFIKIDVEGSELEILEGAKFFLENYSPTLFLATHSKDIHNKCCNFLYSIKYHLESLDTKTIEETDEILAYK